MNKQDMKFVARLLENLPIMPKDVQQSWIDNPKGLKRFLTGLVPPPERIIIEVTTHPQLLQSVTIAPTAGETTLARAKNVLDCRVHDHFFKWSLDVVGVDTEEAIVDIFSASTSINYCNYTNNAALFNSFGVDVRSLCLTQGQIMEYVRSVGAVGFIIDTLFLFEVNSEIFVAVYSYERGWLSNGIHRFSDQYVDSNKTKSYRLVVPQQTV